MAKARKIIKRFIDDCFNTIPKKIVIKALKNIDNFTVIDIEFKSLVLNKQITTPFRIPSGYKSIKF